ncbi:MAG: hypothetical protein HQM06_08855 [Magnetococcales bacterium]|nr:hypothetical protein [Magnetococcales bacterium]
MSCGDENGAFAAFENDDPVTNAGGTRFNTWDVADLSGIHRVKINARKKSGAGSREREKSRADNFEGCNQHREERAIGIKMVHPSVQKRTR